MPLCIFRIYFYKNRFVRTEGEKIKRETLFTSTYSRSELRSKKRKVLSARYGKDNTDKEIICSLVQKRKISLSPGPRLN